MKHDSASHCFTCWRVITVQVRFYAVTTPHLIDQHVFYLSLIIEGATEKVSQFMMSLKSIYNKNFFSEQNVFILTWQND